jgi:hypothetical protein
MCWRGDAHLATQQFGAEFSPQQVGGEHPLVLVAVNPAKDSHVRPRPRRRDHVDR